MKPILYGRVDRIGCQTVILKTPNGKYIDAYGDEVKILTPIHPIQGHKENKKLINYLEQNHDKIVPRNKIGYPEPVTDGHIVYVLLE
jgi:hypothetical protein